MSRIRKCAPEDAAAILSIINAAAEAYRGVVPDDCWKEPYMPAAELAEAMDSGVRFWASEFDSEIVAVMGLQTVRDVDLIRHAYVLPGRQRSGLGSALLTHLMGCTDRRVLVGTWAAASWAVRFYQRHAFELVSGEEALRLLAVYCPVSERQARASVVLTKPREAEPSEGMA